MKICMIGGSGHYQYVLDGLSTAEASLCAYSPGVPGERMDGLRAALQRAGLDCMACEDWRAMLDAQRPDIVVVNTWFGHAAPMAIECLQRGLHVYLEKPLATRMTDLLALHAAYRASDARLGAMFGLRYDPAMYAAWQAVRAGVVGTVRMVSAQKSYRLGVREPFFRARDSYGGTIPWVGAHAIDWLRWFAASEFESVTALHSAEGNRGQGDVEVTASCLFAMQGGVIGQATLDYLRPDSMSRHADDRVRVVGTRGIIEVRDTRVTLLAEDERDARELPCGEAPQCFADFVAEVRGERACLLSASDAFAATQACLLARESADRGETLRITGLETRG